MVAEDGICGSPYDTRDGRCDRQATQVDGRCKYHTEVNEEDRVDVDYHDRTYGTDLYQDRSGYYKGLPEKDQRWVDAISDDLVKKSYYGKEDLSALEKCRQIAIDLHQRRRTDEIIGKNITKEKTVGIHEQYGELTETVENPLFVTKDRLSRESRMAMKDLGILDEEHEEKDDTKETLLDRLSKGLDDEE